MNPALLLACAKVRVDDVVKLLDNGADPNEKENEFPFYSSIHYAAKGGDVQILTILLNTGKVDVNEKDIDGCTPLMIACCNGKVNAAKYLIENGANIDVVTNYGNTVLHRAVRSDRVAMVDVCLTWKGVNVNTKNKKGKTPLIYACFYDDSTSVVNRLVQAGASLNDRDKDNHSALYYAYNKMKWEIVDLLLQQPGIQMKDDEKNTALRRTCEEGRLDDFIKLLYCGTDPNQKENVFPFHSSIHHAAKGGKVEILRIILKRKNVNVNEKDGWGSNPVMIACRHGKIKAVKYLIENGGNIDDVDNYGNTMLHRAVRSDCIEMVDECLKWGGTNVNSKNKKGKTPLIYACFYRHSNTIVNRLLESNASHHERDNDNHSCLDYAHRGKRWDIIDLILQQPGMQIGVNSKDGEGRTLLMNAAMVGRISTVSLLLKQQDTDTEYRDRYGKCALDMTATEEIKDAILKEQDERLWRKLQKGADDFYKLTNKGLSIIINQRDFHMDTNPAYKSVLPKDCLERRNGTDCDCWKLKYTFEKFNCDTVIKENNTEMEIRQLVHYLANGDMDKVDSTKKLEELKYYSCLVFCVLSHGVEGQVYGSNCVPLHIYNDIIYKFNSADCPPLKGKPKIFIIQACQGERTTFVSEDHTSRASSSENTPEITDFLVAFPTIPGHTSLRDPYTGSPFIQTLCKYIEDYGDKKDFEEILRMTRKELSTKTFTNKIGETVTISAQCTSVLRNKVILRSSEPSNDKSCSVM